MVLVVKGDVYYSDSDSDDDDDVDRYVFLARQPAPPPAAAPHAEDGDRGASSEDDDDGGDDDGDATANEEESERGGGSRKRPLGHREILDDAPPPPPKKKKKDRIELTAPPLARTPPSGSGSETESDSAPSPFGVRDGESGSEGSHGNAHEHHRESGIGGEAKNATKKKKRGACGKRRRGPGCDDDDGDRAVMAAAAAKAGAPAAAATATSKRFACNLCERCFDSYRALGGHVLGHRKKAKIAIAAAAACLDADDGGDVGDCREEAAVVEANEETTASGIALHIHKMAAAAARHAKANGGGGGCDGKIKTVDDVDIGGHDDANGDASFRNKGYAAIAKSGKDFTNGYFRNKSRSNGKTTGIGAGIPNQKKVVVGTCHEGDNGDGNVSKTLMYKCKVCGMECPTGRALGGHMRKHRKPPTLAGGDGEGRSSASPPTDDDCRIPLARMFGAETGLQRENNIGWV